LRAISHYRATHCGAPNFAYDLCVAKTPEAIRAELDLSCWRTAYNGAEPVRRETLDRFVRAFAPCGFQPRTLRPAYGLAEATLVVTTSTIEKMPAACPIDTAALERGRVVETLPGGLGAKPLVGSGRAWLGTAVVIADPERRVSCPADVIGEIWTAGP